MPKSFFVPISLVLNIILFLGLAYVGLTHTTAIADDFIRDHHWKFNGSDLGHYCPRFGDGFAYHHLDGNLLYDVDHFLIGVIQARQPKYLYLPLSLRNYDHSVVVYD